MYLPSMSSVSNGMAGQDVCHETSLTLSFSALLIVYVETLSLVRRAVYETPYHPCGGKMYSSVAWDYSHVPFSSPWTVCTNPGTKQRNINLSEFASKRAVVWLRAEREASPESWKEPVPLTVDLGLSVGDSVSLRLQKSGINTWIASIVTRTSPHLAFDVPCPPHTLCHTNSRIFFVS